MYPIYFALCIYMLNYVKRTFCTIFCVWRVYSRIPVLALYRAGKDHKRVDMFSFIHTHKFVCVLTLPTTKTITEYIYLWCIVLRSVFKIPKNLISYTLKLHPDTVGVRKRIGYLMVVCINTSNVRERIYMKVFCLMMAYDVVEKSIK